MLSRFLALGALIALCAYATGCVRTSNANPRDPKASDDLCPYRTSEEWQSFLERFSSNPKWVVTCEDSECDQDYFKFVQENVNDTFQKCAGFIASHPEIGQCTDHLRRFARAWTHQHDPNTYGFNIDNPTYLHNQETPDKPAGMMNPPAEIIAALPVREKVEAAARAAGYPYLTHNSALGGIRTFVLYRDPQGRFDQWLLLNLKEGSSKATSGTPLSIIAVQKKTADGTPLARTRIHFRDYSMVRGRTGAYTLALRENSDGKCYSCHVNGVRQLIARKTPVLRSLAVKGEDGFLADAFISRLPPGQITARSDAYGLKRLEQFNERLRSYGTPDWAGMINPEDHGPALGQRQGCVECHNGRSRGILTVSTSMNQIRQKTFLELAMPYDTHLPSLLEKVQMNEPGTTFDEKVALEKALEAHQAMLKDFESSRLPTLNRWLLATSCTGNGSGE